MAKVKIQGHASGTGVLTVTAPNTSTDRTITLPDATGTLATTADTGVAGITSAADATAMTITSDEKIGIGAATSPNTLVHLKAASGSVLRVEETSGSYIDIEAGGSTGHIKSKSGHDITFSPGGTNHLQLYSSGRAKSQFTARAWIKFDGSGQTIDDSHNVTSLGDWGTGDYGVNFDVSLGNAHYCAQATTSNNKIASVNTSNTVQTTGRCDIEVQTIGGAMHDAVEVYALFFGD